jgi:hypothetical protein
VLDIAHLIDSKCVERYQNKFFATSAMMQKCRMQISGPWPPYHFVHPLTHTVHTHAQQMEVSCAEEAPIATADNCIPEAVPALA